MKPTHLHPAIYFRLKNSGFTLIELLVAVAISSIVLLAIGQFFISTNRTNTVQEKIAATQQDIRATMEMMTRDIRMAGLDPSGNAGNAGFISASNGTNQNSIAFAYDYYDGAGNPESDEDCNDIREYVCYSYDAVNERIMYNWSSDGGANWSSRALTGNGTIDSLTFQYTLSSGSPTGNPGNLSNIREVEITICGKISGAYGEDLQNPYCFTNHIKPRNM
ncbi:MAG: prepilin-type N-terminal cleavage/methylation domain-containing protein [Desulfobacteraceae bacterium]|nr:prepilin-type N-terminal cleavage/methylation domain-containing protein [Desulfobacteraceae bacterium]